MKTSKKTIKNWAITFIFIVYPWVVYLLIINNTTDIVKERVDEIFNTYNIKTL